MRRLSANCASLRENRWKLAQTFYPASCKAPNNFAIHHALKSLSVASPRKLAELFAHPAGPIRGYPIDACRGLPPGDFGIINRPGA